jgi:formylglycine-generating enzyme required for sulfatase activity
VLPKVGAAKPPISFRLGELSTLTAPENTRNMMPFPGWAVPTLFARPESYTLFPPPPDKIKWPCDDKKMIYVPEYGFYIDKYPVTRSEYRRFSVATGRTVPWQATDPQLLVRIFAGRLSRGNPQPDNSTQGCGDSQGEDWEGWLPATDVTLPDALKYAEWAGKHLPTPSEWRQAALAGCESQSWRFPWGNEERPGRCNVRESKYNHPWPVIFSTVLDGCNPVGVCDTVGNVAELAQDEQGAAYLCGGSYREQARDCSVHRLVRIDHPNFTNAGVGFRCAATRREYLTQSGA